MRSAVWLGFACTAIAACASGMRSAREPGTAGPVMATGRDPDHAEIERLANEIAAQRTTGGFTTPLAPPLAQPMTTPLPISTDPTCHHGSGDTCTSACTIADSICANAGKICELAGKLPGDRWAADKCSDGQASCVEAAAKCCGCR